MLIRYTLMIHGFFFKQLYLTLMKSIDPLTNYIASVIWGCDITGKQKNIESTVQNQNAIAGNRELSKWMGVAIFKHRTTAVKLQDLLMRNNCKWWNA